MEPKLVEPGVKYFIDATLKNCHKTKEKYNSTIFNVMIFLIFAFCLACVLVFKYKGKMTPVEKEIESRKKKEYILEKIKALEKSKKPQTMITELPLWGE